MQSILKRLGFVSVLTACLVSSKAILSQIKPVYTQYMMNQYLLNPAVAGTQEYFDIKTSSRYQWIGIEGYPRGYYLSAQGSIGKHHLRKTGPNSKRLNKTKAYGGDESFHGVGGIISSDQTGPTSVVSIYGSYSYNILLKNDVRISLGVAPGLQSFSINSSTFDIENKRDISILVPDLTIGVWFYTPKLYIGASSHQILENKLNRFELYENSNRMKRHYFATAGYKIEINSIIRVVPSVMFRYIYPFPSDVDLNVKTFYKDFLWAGATYRPVSQTFAGIIGFSIQDRFIVSYAYDYFNSYLNTVSFGTHEILLGYKIKKKTNMYSPSDFW